MTSTPTIWFTHSLRPSHRSLLASMNWKWKMFPFLETFFYSVSQINTSLPWVITSQTVVEWINQLPEETRQHICTNVPRWYVIGSSTFQSLSELGVIVQSPPEIESGYELGKLIAADQIKACLHVTGAQHRQELRDFLFTKDISYSTLEVYEKKKVRPELPLDCPPSAICFMSPRTVDACVEAGYSSLLLSDIPLFAIGTTTKNHIESVVGKSAITPPDAHFGSILETITHYFKTSSHVHFS